MRRVHRKPSDRESVEFFYHSIKCRTELGENKFSNILVNFRDKKPIPVP